MKARATAARRRLKEAVAKMRVDEQEADEGVVRGTSDPLLVKSLCIHPLAHAVVPTTGIEVGQTYLGRSASCPAPVAWTERS